MFPLPRWSTSSLTELNKLFVRTRLIKCGYFLPQPAELVSAAYSSTVFDTYNGWGVGCLGEKATTDASDGYINEFRLSVGVARWTANFTVPALPYGALAGSVA